MKKDQNSTVKKKSSSEKGRVLAAHFGHSANCSSIGSFVDFLFLSSVVGGAALSSLEIFLQNQSDTTSYVEKMDPSVKKMERKSNDSENE